jgi:hypothetical protein
MPAVNAKARTLPLFSGICVLLFAVGAVVLGILSVGVPHVPGAAFAEWKLVTALGYCLALLATSIVKFVSQWK